LFLYSPDFFALVRRFTHENSLRTVLAVNSCNPFCDNALQFELQRRFRFARENQVPSLNARTSYGYTR
jgi:hypothetical protein